MLDIVRAQKQEVPLITSGCVGQERPKGDFEFKPKFHFILT